MEVIYLDIDEEITSVIDRIRKSKGLDLVLVIPKRASLGQSIVNLKLLKKQIEIISKNVIVVAPEKLTYNLAKRASLNVRTEIPSEAETEGMMEKEIARPATQKIKIEPEENKKPSKNLEDSPKVQSYLESKEAPTDKRISKRKEVTEKPEPALVEKKPSTSRKKIVFLPKVSVKAFGIFIAASLIITGLVFFFLLPKAEITVKPETEQYVSSQDVVVEKDINEVDLENNAIPGEVVFVEEMSEKKEFKTEGILDIGEKASGEVIIYNSYSSSPQPLVSNTRFLSSDGLIYRISQDISVPGATIEAGNTIPGRIQVQIFAEEEGEDYNGASGVFTIPGLPANKQEVIYAESVSEFSGGQKGTLRVLSEEDLEKAKNELSASVFERALQKLKSKAPKDKIFFENATKREIIETKSSHEVNAETESFNLELKVRLSTLVFQSDNLEQIVSNKVANLESEDKIILNPGVQEGIDAELLNFDFATGKMGIKIRIEKQLAYKVDIEPLKEEIKGHDEEWIRNHLMEVPHVKEVKIDFWPFWVKKSPRVSKKIEIVLDNKL